MSSRYDRNPLRLGGQKDITEFVQGLLERMKAQESSLQIGHTAIEDGNLVIRNGDIIVSESDDSVVIRVVHGGIPEIRFYPLGDTDTHRIAMFGYDFNSGGAPDQAFQLCVETNNLVQDGGKLLMSRQYAILSHQPDGGLESFLWLNAFSPQEALYRGRWTNQVQHDNNMGIYTGVISVGGGFSSWTHTYFTSFATTIAPVVGLVNSGSTVTWTITGMTTSAFTVGWSGTAAKTINFWNFRVA